jgi:hypothetical protein
MFSSVLNFWLKSATQRLPDSDCTALAYTSSFQIDSFPGEMFSLVLNFLLKSATQRLPDSNRTAMAHTSSISLMHYFKSGCKPAINYTKTKIQHPYEIAFACVYECWNVGVL